MNAFPARTLRRFARLFLASMLGMMGCTAAVPGMLAAPETPTTEAPVLAWTAWHLAMIQTGPNAAATPDDPAAFSLVFGEDERVTVITECATASGTLALREAHEVVPNLTISGTCERRSLPERFLNDLNMASSWVFDDDGTLVLNLAADGGFIRLEQALTGPAWRWTGFQGGDDSRIEPGGEVLTLTFQDDGRLTVSTPCVGGTVPYTQEGATGLSITAGGLDVSGCAEGTPAARLVHDLAFMRSFVFRDGKLFVSLMADGGIHTFEASRPET